MPDNTAKGVPYSLGSDPVATIDTTMQELAEWVDAHPGISPLTTTQRNALAGAQLWDGRLIWNLTTSQLERFRAATPGWVGVFQTSYSFRDVHSFTLQGDVRPDNVASDFYITPFFVDIPSGQTVQVRAVRHRLHLVGPAECALDRHRADGVVSRLASFTVTTASARTALASSVDLADGDYLRLVVLSAAAGSKHLTASVAYDTIF